MKVYIITSGEYSDYHVDAVVATEEVAARICRKVPNGETHRYDEMEVLEDVRPITGHIMSWNTYRGGEKDWFRSLTLYPWEYYYDYCVEGRVEAHLPSGPPFRSPGSLHVYGTDEEWVRRTYAENIVRIRGEG